MSKLIIILLIVVLILPSFVFGQKLPETWEDFKGIGQRFLDNILGALKGAWQEAVKIWKKIIGWIGNIWKSYIFPFLEFIWQKIWNFFLEKILEKIKGLMK